MEEGAERMTEDTKLILEEIEKLKTDVREIQLTLENETNKSISIIAENLMKSLSRNS